MMYFHRFRHICERRFEIKMKNNEKMKKKIFNLVRKTVSSKPNDAVRLCMENPEDIDIGKLNLGCLSEISKTDKGVTVKFFDRTKMIELLLENCGDENDGLERFLTAMKSGGDINGD